MTTMTIRRGFAKRIVWTIVSTPGVPADLSDYDQCKCDFDEAEGKADKLTKTASILQTGSGPFVNKGKVSFDLSESDTESWTGNVRMRHQWRLRHRSTQHWYDCGGPDPVVVLDRVADEL